MWEEELHHLVARLEIDPAEEQRRRRSVADELESVLRQENALKQSEVELFGSSQPLYGSKDADIDLCIFPMGRASCNRNDLLGQSTRYCANNDAGKAARNAHAGAIKRSKSLPGFLRRSLRRRLVCHVHPHCSAMYADNAYKIEFFFNASGRIGGRAIATATAKLATYPYSIKKQRSASPTRFLSNSRRTSNYEVLEVISRTRVPIIRFRSSCSEYEYECDLSVGNVIATCNTKLLRAYASFDIRARQLGIAVKYWAKKRGISDASVGFLSSYSYVLLSIYYVQVVHVLPNLQDPDLLDSAKVPAKYYNGVNIAFCEDADIAREFYQRRGFDTDASLQSLLVGFFNFFATHFNFSHCFVAVRSPTTPKLKRHWASCGHRSISIQDPLETTRDLGGVLKRHNQQKVIHEFRRAFGKLSSGERSRSYRLAIGLEFFEIQEI